MHELDFAACEVLSSVLSEVKLFHLKLVGRRVGRRKERPVVMDYSNSRFSLSALET